ncbi:hypothetical protein [Geomonas sp.]|uniref:hypothetical protein n=1 Tax=Geomonas sp. TaxID=2651584 RepID=UPI002B4680E0|nr:hypothetical protein [Geomonas sp.]HJV34726.1 hypothetical protein [Geomonas sp.]
MFLESAKRFPFFCVVCFFNILLTTTAYGDPPEVRVSNFPETQQVKGTVSIDGAAKSVKIQGILLTPSRRDELGELLHAGKLETEGYSSVSLYLQGEIKSTTFLPGAIGIMLIPDEEPILRAFKDVKRIEFPIEAACAIKSGDSEYFSCQLTDQRIGFARYRIFLYDTSNKSADVNAYLYLKK